MRRQIREWEKVFVNYLSNDRHAQENSWKESHLTELELERLCRGWNVADLGRHLQNSSSKFWFLQAHTRTELFTIAELNNQSMSVDGWTDTHTHARTHIHTSIIQLQGEKKSYHFQESNRHRKRSKREEEDMCKRVLKRGQALRALLPVPVACWLSQELGQSWLKIPQRRSYQRLYCLKQHTQNCYDG